MVKAMEFIARRINDEEVFEHWLNLGVAEGDIPHIYLTSDDSDENLESYIEDDNFQDLMQVFLFCMRKAYKSGGLYCDGIVSK